MNSDFESHNHQSAKYCGDLQDGKAGLVNQLMGAMDRCQRDRFELLSAYLDGEVTAAERRQVEEWLKSDAAVQQLYARLLKLRQNLRTLPVPAAQQPVEKTIEQVFDRLNRRYRRMMLGGGAALAALFVGTVSGIFPSGEQFAPQAQQTIQPVTPPQEPLMIALNNPVIEIPKPAVASPEKSVKPGEELKIKN